MTGTTPGGESHEDLQARAAAARRFGKNEVRWGIAWLAFAVCVAVLSFVPGVGHWLMWMALLSAVGAGFTLIRGRGEIHHADVLDKNADKRGADR